MARGRRRSSRPQNGLLRATAPVAFNVLIRCTYRPAFFHRTITSVLLQSHKYFNVIICYDDTRCLEYLQEYQDHPKVSIYEAPDVDKTQKGFYSLYCNFLLGKVKGGWIVFLDDDDMFAGRHTLVTIARNIGTSNDLVTWPVKLGGTVVVPQPANPNYPRYIGAGHFCFHSHHKTNATWVSECNSTQAFVAELLQHKRSFVKKPVFSVLVRTQHRGARLSGLVDGADLRKTLRTLDIDQVRVSRTARHLQPRLLQNYPLRTFTSRYRPAVFFGVSNTADVRAILNHRSTAIVVPHGRDISLMRPTLMKRDIRILAPSRDIQDRLGMHGVYAGRVTVDLVDHGLFPMTLTADRGSKIFVYDGTMKEPDSPSECNRAMINEVVLGCPNDEFIFSSKMSATYAETPEIFRQCRIGLQLGKSITNANMVEEMQAMGIPVVDDRGDSGLRWTTITDIMQYINGIEWNMYAKASQKVLLSLLSQRAHTQHNIRIFDGLVSRYKSILFITEKPVGDQGPCGKMHTRYSKKGHNTMVCSTAHVDDTTFVPDLIVVSSPVEARLGDKFKCPVFYLVTPGAGLDMRQFERSDYSFVSSPGAQAFLKAEHGIRTYVVHNFGSSEDNPR